MLKNYSSFVSICGGTVHLVMGEGSVPNTFC